MAYDAGDCRAGKRAQREGLSPLYTLINARTLYATLYPAALIHEKTLELAQPVEHRICMYVLRWR